MRHRPKSDAFAEMEGKIYDLARWCDLAHICLAENDVKIEDDADGTQMLLGRISEKSKELLIMYERAFQERCASKH